MTDERFKAEALIVLDEWERLWEALGRPGRIGQSKAEASREMVVGMLDRMGDRARAGCPRCTPFDKDDPPSVRCITCGTGYWEATA